MRTKRRCTNPIQPDLFSALESPRHQRERLRMTGNYATRTVRTWIRSDPFTLTACQELANDARGLRFEHAITRLQRETLQRAALTLQLVGWFSQIVHVEEPSTTYADFLCESTDVEWETLAEELLAGEWEEDRLCPLHPVCRGILRCFVALGSLLLHHFSLVGIARQGVLRRSFHPKPEVDHVRSKDETKTYRPKATREKIWAVPRWRWPRCLAQSG